MEEKVDFQKIFREDSTGGIKESFLLKVTKKIVQKIIFFEARKIEKKYRSNSPGILVNNFEAVKKQRFFLTKQLEDLYRVLSPRREALRKQENEIITRYFNQLKDQTHDLLKNQIRKIEDKNLRESANKFLAEVKESRILDAIKNKSVTWQRAIKKDTQLGAGMDERIIELPLALEAGNFLSGGKVLDAGAALNIRYIQEFIGKPVAKIVHFTQSASKEELRSDDDKISYLFGDLRIMDFKDETFDRILCISTLEHVGMDNSRYGGSVENNPDSYLDVIKELLRVLKRKGCLLLTFPYGKAENFSWYHVFDELDVQKIFDLCQGCTLREKYFYYDKFWYEGSKIMPEAKKEEEGITGLAALLITKN